jgi:hypothetical protein
MVRSTEQIMLDAVDKVKRNTALSVSADMAESPVISVWPVPLSEVTPAVRPLLTVTERQVSANSWSVIDVYDHIIRCTMNHS